MVVTPLYAGLLAVLFLYLSVQVIGRRRVLRLALGDGGDRLMQRRCRAHANFAEYAPLALILMALAELQSLPFWPLHMIGLALLTGRLLHAYGVSQEPEPMKLRTIGMALTFAAIALGALANLILPLVRLARAV